MRFASHGTLILFTLTVGQDAVAADPIPLTVEYAEILDHNFGVKAQGVPPLTASYSCRGTVATVDVTASGGGLQIAAETAANTDCRVWVSFRLGFDVPSSEDFLFPVIFTLERTSGTGLNQQESISGGPYDSVLLQGPAVPTAGFDLHLKEVARRSQPALFVSSDSVSGLEGNMILQYDPSGTISASYSLSASAPSQPVAAPTMSGLGRVTLTALLLGSTGIMISRRRGGAGDD